MYKVAKLDNKWYVKTSFNKLEIQPLEFKGTSSNGFYEINSFKFFTFKDNRELLFSDVKEISVNEASFTLDGKITGKITYEGDVYGKSNGIAKLLLTSGWFYPINLNKVIEKPSIKLEFNNIVPKLSKISWKEYNASSAITKLNLIAEKINISNEEITKQEILLNQNISILEMYKNRGF